MSFLVRLLINAAALWVATLGRAGRHVHGKLAAVSGRGVRVRRRERHYPARRENPHLPLIILTLGLFALVVNGLMLWLTSSLSSALGLGFHVDGFWAAFWGALVVSIVSTILSIFVPDSVPLAAAEKRSRT